MRFGLGVLATEFDCFGKKPPLSSRTWAGTINILNLIESKI